MRLDGAEAAASPKAATGVELPNTVVPRVEAFGFQVNLGQANEYIDLIDHAVAARERLLLLNHNLHSLFLYFSYADLRQMFDRHTVMIDGIPVVWLLKLKQRAARRCHRVTWMDFFWPLMERAVERGWRVFHLGGEEVVLRHALAEVRKRHPALKIAGHHGFFDATPGSLEDAEIVRQINTFRADLILVGMGMPRQEIWAAAHHVDLTAPVVLTCGACLEYVAGAVRTPPRWLGSLGFEWLFRLCESPHRYGHRYVVEPWQLLLLMVRHNLGRRRMLRTKG